MRSSLILGALFIANLVSVSAYANVRNYSCDGSYGVRTVTLGPDSRVAINGQLLPTVYSIAVNGQLFTSPGGFHIYMDQSVTIHSTAQPGVMILALQNYIWGVVCELEE